MKDINFILIDQLVRFTSVCFCILNSLRFLFSYITFARHMQICDTINIALRTTSNFKLIRVIQFTCKKFYLIHLNKNLKMEFYRRTPKSYIISILSLLNSLFFITIVNQIQSFSDSSFFLILTPTA